MPTRFSRRAAIKAAILLTFVGRGSGNRALSGSQRTAHRRKVGCLAGRGRPLGAPGFYPVLCHGSLPVPSRHLLAALGVAIFGAYWGFLYVWFGAMLGAGGGFVIGRTWAGN